MIKSLLYAQALGFKTFHIFCPVLTSLSHENTIETSLTSINCCPAKFCKVDGQSQALDFTGETSFSSRFFFNISKISTSIKNRLNTSLVLLGWTKKIQNYKCLMLNKGIFFWVLVVRVKKNLGMMLWRKEGYWFLLSL